MSAVVFLLAIAGALIYLCISAGRRTPAEPPKAPTRKEPREEPEEEPEEEYEEECEEVAARPRTIRCPTCGARARVHGDMWECGFCGDCGMLKK